MIAIRDFFTNIFSFYLWYTYNALAGEQDRAAEFSLGCQLTRF
jgi:hypothetical protein